MCIFPQLKNTLQVKENNGLWVKAKTGHWRTEWDENCRHLQGLCSASLVPEKAEEEKDHLSETQAKDCDWSATEDEGTHYRLETGIAQ
jgi:hypothetical protein